MPKLHLTDIVIQRLEPPPAGNVTFWDTSLPAFGCRISSRGTKTWTIVYGKNRNRKALGRYPSLSLAKARSTAKRLFSQHRHDATTITFAAALTLFLETHCARRHRARTADEHKRLLTKHLLPSLRSKRLSDITPHQVSRVIDALLATPSEANHLFKSARTFFRWATRRSFISISPLQVMQMPARETARDRVLTDTELLSVWRAAERQGYPHGTIVKLLILTGQRRGEIASLRWEFIDGKNRVMTFPPSITKNGREHRIPYSSMVAAVLENIPNESGLLFPARGKDTPFSGWSKSKETLECDPAIQPWTLHDLRRTFATNLAALGVPPHITERLLNHVSGTTSGIATIYNRHAYMDEMRDAVAKRNAYLTSLVQS